jgi:GNAT superfamily N-acetyltransferase
MEDEAPLLSALAQSAKAHWGYFPETLDTWRSQLTIADADIQAKPVFVAMADGEVAGFYSLAAAGSSWELDNLWVLPKFMDRGIGRSLLAHALDVAWNQGAAEVTVDSDPNAEPFYLACGAIRRGELPAPIAEDPSRVRPQLVFNTRMAHLKRVDHAHHEPDTEL